MATVLGEFEADLTMDSNLSDADGDGIGDLVVGAQQEEFLDTPGKAMLFLGPLEGTLTREDADRVWVGDQAGSRFDYGQ